MRYPKECILKDCKEAVIRPLQAEDEPALRRFYEKTSEIDRWCMRWDPKDENVVQRWFTRIERGDMHAIVGLCGQEIVGHGILHLRSFGSRQHVGRFRIVVQPEFRQQRLGTWLLLDLIQLAMDKGLESLRTDLVVGIEDTAIEAVTKFDFFREAVLRDYVKDPQGNRRDMVIMVKRLHKGFSDF